MQKQGNMIIIIGVSSVICVYPDETRQILPVSEYFSLIDYMNQLNGQNLSDSVSSLPQKKDVAFQENLG